MDINISFLSALSGTFLSEGIFSNEESIISKILYGYVPKKVESQPVYRQNSEHQAQSIKRDLSSAVLRYGHSLVISECLDKLDILRLTMRQTVNSRWYDDIQYRPPHKRFHENVQQMDEDDYNLHEYTNIRKVSKDICIIYNILMKCLTEFEATETADNLLKSVNILEQEHCDVKNFRYELEDNRNCLCNVLQDVRNSQKLNMQKYDNKASELYNIQQQYEDIILFSKIKMSYLDRWEDHRYHLNVLSNDQKERELLNLAEEYQQKIYFDERVHYEICNYMKCSVINMQEQTEYWMEEYDRMVDKIDSDIYAVKIMREQSATEFDAMTAEYKMRAQEIVLWLEYKEQLRKKMELEEIMRKAATKIQAWWRGTMVRRKLGRYGRKKKGRKGKNKKNPKKLKKKP